MTAVAEASQLDLRHILEADDVAGIVRLEDDVLVVGEALQTPLVAERILVGAVARFTETPWSGLEVLRCEQGGDIAWNKGEGAHLVGVKPQTHRIGILAEGIR